MQLHEYSAAGTDVLQLTGEIDLHYAPALRALLGTKKNAQCAALLLDLSGVPFIDSSGLAALILYLRDSAKFGGRFAIGGISEQLRWTFETTQLDKVMPLFTSVDEAKAALASGRAPQPARQLFAPLAA